MVDHILLDCWDAVFFSGRNARDPQERVPINAPWHTFSSGRREKLRSLRHDPTARPAQYTACPMAGFHADIDVRPVHKYFIERMCFLKESYNDQQPTAE